MVHSAHPARDRARRRRGGHAARRRRRARRGRDPLRRSFRRGRPRSCPPRPTCAPSPTRSTAPKKVAIFAGAGVAGAHDEVRRFAELLAAPVGHSLRGKEWIQYDNPFDVGMTGLLGYGAAHDGIHDADLLLLLGTDFPYDQFLPGEDDVVTAQVDARRASRAPASVDRPGARRRRCDDRRR